MKRIQCDARAKKISPYECRPNPAHNKCQRCPQGVRSLPVEEPERKLIDTSPQSATAKKARRKASKKRKVPQRVSTESTQIELGIDESKWRSAQLYEQLPTWPGIPLHTILPDEEGAVFEIHRKTPPPLTTRKLKKVEEQLARELEEQACLKEHLYREKIRIKSGEDFDRLVAKAQNHWDSNPFRPTVNHALLELIAHDRSILLERWVIRKILMEDIRGNTAFLEKLAAIIAKPSTRRDGRVNKPLFDFVKAMQKDRPEITYPEMFAKIESRFAKKLHDNTELRRQLGDWGFKFPSAKKGRKPKA